MPKKKPAIGSITWHDLTVPHAAEVRDFYSAVVGWKAEAFKMPGGEDYVMKQPGNGKVVAGICHASGVNQGIPAQWLAYLTVADLTASLRACRKHGGKVVTKTRKFPTGRFAIVQDPAGAVAALYEAT